jgi:hypothetical protein
MPGAASAAPMGCKHHARGQWPADGPPRRALVVCRCVAVVARRPVSAAFLPVSRLGGPVGMGWLVSMNCARTQASHISDSFLYMEPRMSNIRGGPCFGASAAFIFRATGPSHGKRSPHKGGQYAARADITDGAAIGSQRRRRQETGRVRARNGFLARWKLLIHLQSCCRAVSQPRAGHACAGEEASIAALS